MSANPDLRRSFTRVSYAVERSRRVTAGTVTVWPPVIACLFVTATCLDNGPSTRLINDGPTFATGPGSAARTSTMVIRPRFPSSAASRCVTYVTGSNLLLVLTAVPAGIVTGWNVRFVKITTPDAYCIDRSLVPVASISTTPFTMVFSEVATIMSWS